MANSTSQSPARSVAVEAVVEVEVEVAAPVVARVLLQQPTRDRSPPLRVSFFSWSMESQSRRQHHRLRGECP